MFSFKKKSKLKITNDNTNDESLDENFSERLFFHDLINQTHGVLLYLSQKEIQQVGLGVDEVKMLSSEMKALQSLIRDHYNFGHKNLIHTFDWVPLYQAQLMFLNLKNTYLSDTDVSIHFNFDSSRTNEHLIYFPNFYRIMNNLIKNISESKTEKVEFHFSMNEDELIIESKNLMKKTDEKEMSEYLAQVILNEKTSTVTGLGLESIHHLIEKNGGSFTFEILDHSWINRLKLPIKKMSSLKISA